MIKKSSVYTPGDVVEFFSPGHHWNGSVLRVDSFGAARVLHGRVDRL